MDRQKNNSPPKSVLFRNPNIIYLNMQNIIYKANIQNFLEIFYKILFYFFFF